MGKLTETQRGALETIRKDNGSRFVRFQTGEALRKRGLADRYTVYSIKAEYVQQNALTIQWERPAHYPSASHEWYITAAGRRALEEEG